MKAGTSKSIFKNPNLIIDFALSKLLNYIPKLNFKYDSMAAKIRALVLIVV
jgi:hypothetical protein